MNTIWFVIHTKNVNTKSSLLTNGYVASFDINKESVAVIWDLNG